ncbi:7-carboxy-7-deazaguanine synthase QueE [Micromonospora sp. Llam7]|uniref:7-carboxy-7-deazaguanine synthase QueE n=1 Tax=Micromonospora tarapacensis TaxID=2835305 RepID=UPI001C82EAAC|nr:7-carboxy-7-deazaguanine synthase QueE [Micromonospora tarapacensis]MBX7267524.1 7-carboxy-7-deazaguanine synthase QueE [Micromonospora tarapacensis]
MTARTATRPLLVAETFGPTFQGEGPSCGQQAIFVRLSRCNLSCPTCDTPYTWDRTRFDLRAESRPVPGDQLVAWVLRHPTDLVVFTGGEPLLQQNRLLPVVQELTAARRRVEVETNGTVEPRPALVEAVAAFNVSPKLDSFAAPEDAARRINPQALRVLAGCGRAAFKFVVTDRADLAEIARLCDEYRLDPVWVMPEGTTPDRIITVMREVADPVLAHGWHLTSRLHVLLWGDVRGR